MLGGELGPQKMGAAYHCQRRGSSIYCSSSTATCRWARSRHPWAGFPFLGLFMETRCVIEGAYTEFPVEVSVSWFSPRLRPWSVPHAPRSITEICNAWSVLRAASVPGR